MALLKYWDGSQWVVAPNGAVTALDDLSDVTLTAAANDDFLQRKSGVWVNRTVAQVMADLAFQPLDSDLTTIAGLTATTDSFMQAKASAWSARTLAQVRADLATATAPITFSAGVIAISAATTGAAGSLSAADKAALDLLAVKDYCLAFHNTTQAVVGTGTAAAVAFNSEQADTAGYHDDVTNNSRLTVPTGKGGLYLVGAMLRWNNTAGGTRRVAEMRVNGSINIGGDEASPGSFVGNTVSTVVFLSATDYVEVYPTQDSGVSINLLSSANAWPKMWLVRLSG